MAARLRAKSAIYDCLVFIGFSFSETKHYVTVHTEHMKIISALLAQQSSASLQTVPLRGGFNGRPPVQWPTGPLALEAPGRGARPENNGSCIEFMISKTSKRCSTVATLHATRCHNLMLKCTKFDFGCGSAPDPDGGAYRLQRSPRPLAGFNDSAAESLNRS